MNLDLIRELSNRLGWEVGDIEYYNDRKIKCFIEKYNAELEL